MFDNEKYVLCVGLKPMYFDISIHAYAFTISGCMEYLGVVCESGLVEYCVIKDIYNNTLLEYDKWE